MFFCVRLLFSGQLTTVFEILSAYVFRWAHKAYEYKTRDPYLSFLQLLAFARRRPATSADRSAFARSGSVALEGSRMGALAREHSRTRLASLQCLPATHRSGGSCKLLVHLYGCSKLIPIDGSPEGLENVASTTGIAPNAGFWAAAATRVEANAAQPTRRHSTARKQRFSSKLEYFGINSEPLRNCSE